ncbi:MAG: tetratricopeptide repeat protein [Terracidiphilus sp.]
MAEKTEPSNKETERNRPEVWPAAGPSGLGEIARRYKGMLEENPRQPEALVGMSLVALASRQTEAAIKMAAAGAAAAPKMGGAWVALGQALKAGGRLEEADEAYEEAIRLNGMDPLARMARGELRLATGRHEDAIREFEMVLLRKPAQVPAHLGMGNALAILGRLEEALEWYRKALAIQPRLPEGEFAAGFALARLGRAEEAERRYRRALTLRPDFAAAWINLGSLLRELGRDTQSRAALRRGVELRPDLVSGWVNLAILEKERGRADAAETYLRKALKLNIDQVETLVAWCQCRIARRDLPGAWGWLRWALARNPEFDEAVNLHGILLHLEGRFVEAVPVFERAEALGNSAAASNRGNSLLDLGRMEEALRAHQAAVERDPAGAGGMYNLALTQLRLGDWEHGWAGYEARWRFREVHRAPRKFAKPRWKGEELKGKRILLHAEQGLGDTIQFCRYAELVAERGGAAILEVQPAAERLMRSLAVVRAGRAETVVRGAQLPKFDCECPLLSLPAVFGTTVETVPWEGAYLSADEEITAEKRERFAATPTERLGRPGLRAGLAWAGNPKYKADGARSTRLEVLVPLLRAVDANWISLQKGEAAKQLSQLPGDVSVQDGSSGERDLAETAALVSTLDLVVTTDTSIAHLAGAMGKPVWILLPHLADWRWMQERETTPWYPTARLYRQRAPGDWAEVLERVIRQFGELASQRCVRSSGAGDENPDIPDKKGCFLDI